ncbi:MAG: PKD domain-containing protein, partial [Thermoplasmata archaeon]
MRGFKREKGVSNIVTTVLTIAITVMLFTSAFFFVSSNMPTVTRSNVSSFSSSYSFADAGSGRAYLMVSLKNLYGQDLPTASTSFNIVVSGPVSFAYSHPLSAFVSGPYLKVNQSFVYNSQVDRETIPASAEGSLSVLVTLVDENAHRIIWYSSLSGAQSSGNLQIASFQPVTVSVGAPVNLTAVAGGGDPPYTYSWSYTGPGGWFTNTNGPTTTFYPSKPGTYTVSAIVRDSFSATSSKYITYSTGSVGPRAIVRSITLNVVNSSGIYAPHLMVQLYGPQPLYNNGVYSINFYGYVDMPPENGYNHEPYDMPVEFTVTLDGASKTSAPQIVFNVQNGTHYFKVQNMTGVTGIWASHPVNLDAMPWSGKIIVSGQPVAQYILFHDQYYSGDSRNNLPAGWILQFTTANATYNLFAPYAYIYGYIHNGAYGSYGSNVFAYTESDSYNYNSNSGSEAYVGVFDISSPIIYISKNSPYISLNVLAFAYKPPVWDRSAVNKAQATVSWVGGSTIYNNQALSKISTVDYPYCYG